MASVTLTHEEFDARLVQSTEQMRQKRLILEAQAAELEELIGKYSAVLERLEVRRREPEPEAATDLARRDSLRQLLTELAERTSAVAASL